jgi:hypothetical protein
MMASVVLLDEPAFFVFFVLNLVSSSLNGIIACLRDCNQPWSVNSICFYNRSLASSKGFSLCRV